MVDADARMPARGELCGSCARAVREQVWELTWGRCSTAAQTRTGQVAGDYVAAFWEVQPFSSSSSSSNSSSVYFAHLIYACFRTWLKDAHPCGDGVSTLGSRTLILVVTVCPCTFLVDACELEEEEALSG